MLCYYALSCATYFRKNAILKCENRHFNKEKGLRSHGDSSSSSKNLR